MAVIYATVGLENLQSDIVNKLNPVDYTMILYTAGTPSIGAVLGDFTELVVSGYTAETMTGATWTVVDGLASYPEITFNLLADAQVKGFAIKRDSVLICSEDFPTGPFDVPVAGGDISVTFSQNLS